MEKGRESGNTTGDNMWVCPKCGVYVVSMRTLVQTNRAFSWISQLLAEIQVVPTAVLAMSLNKVSCQSGFAFALHDHHQHRSESHKRSGSKYTSYLKVV